MGTMGHRVTTRFDGDIAQPDGSSTGYVRNDEVALDFIDDLGACA